LIERRHFVAMMGSVIVVPSLAAHAQRPVTPVIGFLNNLSPGAIAHPMAAFRNGLKEAGYVEGQNLTVEYRWGEGHNDQLSEMATDLVRREIAVIVATGGGASALAAKAATATIPIVFPQLPILSSWASLPALTGPAATPPAFML
jgi:putative ABC transport system substrate-binding protein